MKILIVSDSHGRHTNLERAIKKVSPIDMLIHLGDLEGDASYINEIANCQVEMVSGNNDYFTDIPREKFLEIGKYYVMLTHGHRYGVNYGTEQLIEAAKLNGADIVMFGHTHQPLIDLKDESLSVINPGSITQPRQTGRIPTFIIMEIDAKGEAHYTLNFIEDSL